MNNTHNVFPLLLEYIKPRNMKDLRIWITYHDDNQIDEFELKEDETFHLFKGNDLTVEGENINYLNRFYSELTTLYWVWKNKVRSKMIGFCHYRRMFTHIIDIEPGTCQVMKITNMGYTIEGYYRLAHNYNDMYDIIEILNEKYGTDNIYTKYLLKDSVFIPFCCFIMCYEDFEKLCEFLFPILFAYDEKNGLNMNPVNYREKAERDFRYGDVNYQQRAVSFLAERIISAYLVNHMNLVCVQTYSHRKET